MTPDVIGREEGSAYRGAAAWPELVILALLAVNAAVAVAGRHFPFIDSVNHLARYAVIAKALAGQPTPDFSFDLLPTPYVGLDLAGALLVRLVGVDAALLGIGLAALTFPAISLYALLATARPERRAWAVVGCLTAWNAFFILGFANYVIGVGGAIAWLAGWYRRRSTSSWAVRGLLGAGIALLYLIHLSAPLIALTVVWTEVLLVWVRLRWPPRAPSATSDHEARAILVTAVPATAGFLIMMALTRHGTSAVKLLDTDFRSPLGKATHLLTPWYSFSYAQMAVLAAGYGLTLLAFLVVYRRYLRLDCFLLGSVALLTAYLVTPSNKDVRWLLPAYLLVFVCGNRSPVQHRRALLFPVIATLVHAGVVLVHLRESDRKLDAFADVLARLPAGSRLLSTVCCDQRGFPPANPYRHFAQWHAIRRNGKVAGLFSAAPTTDDGAPSPHLAHFRIVRRLSNPATAWLVEETSDAAWRRLLEEFDYVILAGPEPRLHRAFEAREGDLREVYRAGEVRLYQVVLATHAGTTSVSP